jgi:hypothetical protein
MKKLTQSNKGQSFMEMTIVIGVLLLLLIGVVELGYLMNRYIVLVDATREGTRFGSSGKIDPYIRTTSPYVQNPNFFLKMDNVIEGDGTAENSGALDTILLNEATDDIIITFYRIVNARIEEKFGPWHKYAANGYQPRITDATIESGLDIKAPNSGVLVVEIFYSHNQLLKFPIFTTVIPDPMQVHAYSVMPLNLAKPTPHP